MIRYVQCWHRAPRKELLGEPWVIDLMHHDIEPVDLREGIHFKLASPARVLTDPGDVVVDVFVFLDKKLV